MTDKTELEQVNEILERLEWCDYDDIDFGRGFEEYAPLVKQALTEKRDRLTTGGWLDIESAPRDGTHILILAHWSFDYVGEEQVVYDEEATVRVCMWYKQNKCFGTASNMGEAFNKPTKIKGWQPLPTGGSDETK